MNETINSTKCTETPAIPTFPTSIDAEIAAIGVLAGLLAEAIEDIQPDHETCQEVRFRMSPTEAERLSWLSNELALRSGRLDEIWTSGGAA